MKKLLKLIIMYVSLFCPLAFAAEVSNVKLVDQGDFVVITYDLASKRKCEISLVGVDAKTKKELVFTALFDDIGEVRPGGNKKITWKWKYDYPNGIDGMNIELEVKAAEYGVDIVTFTDVGKDNPMPRMDKKPGVYRPVSVEIKRYE